MMQMVFAGRSNERSKYVAYAMGGVNKKGAV